MRLHPRSESSTPSGKSGRKSRSIPDSTLLDVYKIAVDEYRFQVQLNWSRTQYYLVFNVGLVGVATGLTRFVAFPMTLVLGGLYLAGIICCVLSLLAKRAQREYYRNTRDRLKEIEKLLKVQDVGIVTTSKMGGRARRFGRVATMNQLVLLTLLALNLLGASLMIGRAIWH